MEVRANEYDLTLRTDICNWVGGFLLVPGDWHTAYLLLYGPRKLPLAKEDEKKEEETAKSTEETADKPMETS